MLYLVLYDYEPTEETELALHAGDFVTKDDEEDGWVKGKNVTTGESGWYSPEFVKKTSK